MSYDALVDYVTGHSVHSHVIVVITIEDGLNEPAAIPVLAHELEDFSADLTAVELAHAEFLFQSFHFLPHPEDGLYAIDRLMMVQVLSGPCVEPSLDRDMHVAERLIHHVVVLGLQMLVESSVLKLYLVKVRLIDTLSQFFHSLRLTVDLQVKERLPHGYQDPSATQILVILIA